MNNHAKGFDPGLGRVFNFDAADLDANRAGRLSEQQELILRNTVRVQVRHASRARVMVAIAFVVAIVGIAIGIAVTPRGGATAAMVAALILLWVGAIVIWGVRKGRRHTEAVTNARVHLAEGEVRVEPAYSGEHYWAHIGQVRFGIDTDQWDELDDDAR